MAMNLASVRHICREWNAKAQFHQSHCAIIDSMTRKEIARGDLDSDLYLLNCASQNTSMLGNANLARKASPDNPTFMRHYRLGHPSLKRMAAMLKGDLYRDAPKYTVDSDRYLLCEACIVTKSVKRNQKNTNPTKATKLLRVVNTDLCGPMSTSSFSGARYFMGPRG